MPPSDEAAIFNAVDQFYEAAVSPGQWPGALAALAKAVNGAGAALLPSDPELHGIAASLSLKAPLERYTRSGQFKNDAMHDEARSAMLFKGFCTRQELAAAGSFAGKPFLGDYMQAEGFGGFAAAGVWQPFGEYVYVAVQRAAGAPDFTREDCVALDRSLAHFRRAASVAMQLGLSRNEGVLDGFSALRRAAALIDQNGGIARINAPAEAMLGQEITLREARLTLNDPRSQARLDGQIRVSLDQTGSNDHEYGDFVIVRRKQHLRPIVLQVIPLVGSASDIFRSASAILLFNDLERQTRSRADMLAAALELRPSEARVAGLLADGNTLADIGENLKLSRETVRSYVKAILVKARVNKQSAFVSVASRLETPVSPRP